MRQYIEVPIPSSVQSQLGRVRVRSHQAQAPPGTYSYQQDASRVGISDIPLNNARPVVKLPLPLQKLTPGYGSAHAAGDVEGKRVFKYTCDDVKFIVLCPDNPKHHKILAKYCCHRPGCPVCWTGWASNASKDAAARIEGYRDAHGTQRRPRHISFSPPPGTITELQDLLKQTNRIMKKVGVEAAAAIPHPYRLVKGDDDGRRDLKSRANRYREALDSPEWRTKVRFSPHVHAMIYGPLPDADEFARMTGGWVYRNHEKDDGRRGRLGDELEATIYYLLTHAWAHGNNAVVRYWFGMSTRKLGKSLGEPYFETEQCPVCKVDCVKVPPDIVQYDGTVIYVYQNLHNAPPATRKIKTWTFFVRSASSPPAGPSAKSRSIWGPAGCPAEQCVLL
jgi:hypothetical protein